MCTTDLRNYNITVRENKKNLTEKQALCMQIRAFGDIITFNTRVGCRQRLKSAVRPSIAAYYVVSTWKLIKTPLKLHHSRLFIQYYIHPKTRLHSFSDLSQGGLRNTLSVTAPRQYAIIRHAYFFVNRQWVGMITGGVSWERQGCLIWHILCKYLENRQ